MKKIIIAVVIWILIILKPFSMAYGMDEGEITTISLVGDVMMDGTVKKAVEKYGYFYPWGRVQHYFKNSHLSIVNLETSITDKETIWPDKEFNFKSSPKNLDAMKKAGINIATLANNHILDYGYEGLLDTLMYLEESGIQYVGAGRNKKEALKGTIVEANGLKFGVIAFSRVIPHVNWYATDKRPGLVGAYDGFTKDMMNRIEGLKKEVDILILSIHWGKERSTYPRKEEIAVAKEAIDRGVDIVMGHHPHVLQGIEIYKDKPIFYSLGNFVFGSKDELTKTTMIGQVVMKGKKIDRVEIIPCSIMDGRPIPLEDNEKSRVIGYIKDLSKPFKTNITSDGTIRIKSEK
ncbi:CapA family protein [Tepidimicrobium xylanilyticum]|uniref:Poly-gamma-glutamate biosynthesis protein CapA/YwtB (Capsule formation), metallophosphatase superfamily n=1 Tax=Tepidimicrobium xylanilyticum TaxID=1123352 RepID=A0A1H2XKD2_9FIRM|nr:CapA family protein [Tepidimicrobium xylanilyticum]GMG97529.1 capsular polysaccharide biosynthesis protein [Tepidimicrobium xylanilyticum]SDW93300.1 Poly-gamma-glutamate biosynthesis protein CapA/YwtB (capsule formation), metallophosphatase superfamily [Tepidimicrobium xylanilyticum]